MIYIYIDIYICIHLFFRDPFSDICFQVFVLHGVVAHHMYIYIYIYHMCFRDPFSDICFQMSVLHGVLICNIYVYIHTYVFQRSVFRDVFSDMCCAWSSII